MARLAVGESAGELPWVSFLYARTHGCAQFPSDPHGRLDYKSDNGPDLVYTREAQSHTMGVRRKMHFLFYRHSSTLLLPDTA